jgi:UDP-galactopyranose mutase
MYDYLIVGSGLFGSIFAYEAKKRGFSVKVLERRNHIGGNIYTEKIEDINIHKYGAHIFHTSNKEIWEYINQFAEFNHYVNSPIANYCGEIYNLPFNMNTFNKLWGVITPEEAKKTIDKQKVIVENPKNLEEQALTLVGVDIYKKLVKGYTEKQWGRQCSDLPPSIIKRIPLRFTYNNNYFNDKYQGIPIGGYTKIIEQLLDGVEVELEIDYLKNRDFYDSTASKVLYTGMIDEFYEYKFGYLEYRSLKFVHETIDIDNYQGNAVVNYTDESTQFTRIIEHKHFEFGTQEKTIITREYPKNWIPGEEAYYPINDTINDNLFREYKKIASQEKKHLFGGRLADYRYYDMHNVIAAAIAMVKKELDK